MCLRLLKCLIEATQHLTSVNDINTNQTDVITAYMGIYYQRHACGCVTAGTSHDPYRDNSWIHKSCDKKCTLHQLTAVDLKKEQAEADKELFDRLGITSERLELIRGN